MPLLPAVPFALEMWVDEVAASSRVHQVVGMGVAENMHVLLAAMKTALKLSGDEHRVLRKPRPIRAFKLITTRPLRVMEGGEGMCRKALTHADDCDCIVCQA